MDSPYRAPATVPRTLQLDLAQAIDDANDAVREALFNSNRIENVAIRRSMQDHLGTAMLKIRRIQDPLFHRFDDLEARVAQLEVKLGMRSVLAPPDP